MDAKQAWNQWLIEAKAAAADLDAAARALDLLPLSGDDLLATLGPLGRESLSAAMLGLRAERALRVRLTREAAAKRREEVKIAKWLGDPARAAVFDIVAQPTHEAQFKARAVALTRSAMETIRSRDLWRSNNPTWALYEKHHDRIDRIVAGARLYAESRKA